MARPRDVSSEGSRNSASAGDGYSSGTGSSRSGSTTSDDDNSGSSPRSSIESGSSSSLSRTGGLAVGSRSESSSVATSIVSSTRTRASSQRGGSSGSSSSSSSSSSAASGEGTTLKSRMKALFKDQPEVETAEPEGLTLLHDRVDAKLLTEVQEYDAAPSDAAAYGKNAFWDERYANDEEVVEWYHPWANLAPTLTQYMDEQDEVLVCGCGNSEMSVDMYDDGFENVTNADLSRVVIHQMKETYKAYEDMEWKSVDLTREEFREEMFDVALDKACLDSIMCNPHGGNRVDHYLQQMDRILQPEGAFICVSFAPPDERLELLEYWDLDKPEKCLAWHVHVDAIAKPEVKRGRSAKANETEVYYIYVCIKDPGKTAQKKLAKERVKREQEKKLAKMLGHRGRGRGRGRGRRP